MMDNDLFKSEFLAKYKAVGGERFYKFLLIQAISKLVSIEGGSYKGTPPELEYLNYSDRFIILYRREGDELFLKLAKIFRRAAHRVYRIMLKKSMTVPNAKFLNAV
jgi:hypothetical protein